MSKQWDKWDTIESLRKSRDGWYDETQLQLARAEAAETKVKVLEQALRNIAEGKYHDIEGDAIFNQWCSCADVIARAALAAKEKP